AREQRRTTERRNPSVYEADRSRFAGCLRKTPTSLWVLANVGSPSGRRDRHDCFPQRQTASHIRVLASFWLTLRLKQESELTVGDCRIGTVPALSPATPPTTALPLKRPRPFFPGLADPPPA